MRTQRLLACMRAGLQLVIWVPHSQLSVGKVFLVYSFWIGSVFLHDSDSVKYRLHLGTAHCCSLTARESRGERGVAASTLSTYQASNKHAVMI